MKSTKKDLILKISKKYGLTHIGSCLSVLPILEEIYNEKGKEDIVIMDNAHAHLAHLLFLHASPTLVEKLIHKDIHCNRPAGCDAQGGSLGHGLGISIGYALAGRRVYCVVSDGSMMEGSNWEALRIIDSLNLPIKIYVNANGFSAVAPVDPYFLKLRMQLFLKGIEFRQTDNGEGFEGVQGHYKQI